MSNYSTDASIISQTAAKVAADLIIGGVATLDDFQEVQTMVFNQIIASAGAETLVEIFENQSKRGGGNSGGFKSRSNAPREDVPAEDVVVNFGKYRGKTVSSILTDDAEYVQWLAENANHADVKAAAGTLLAASAS